MDALATMHGCMAAFQGSVGRAARAGLAFEHDGVVAAVVPGLPELVLVNAAVYRDATSLADALPDLEEAYDVAGVRRSMVWVPPDDDDALELLQAAGYVLYAEAPAMALELSLLPADDDPIDDWSAAPEPAEIAQVVERSYGLDDGAASAAFEGWLDRGVAYVARLEGRAVSCLTVLRDGPDAGVFMVGTVPEARGRGLARRLLLRALHDARDDGASVSTLQSSLLGYPVYRRLGYVELLRLGMWERGR